MLPSLSILVPVYNAARHLPAALASLRAQTFTDFELVVVNDGSTDDSGRLLERAAAEDARVRVLQQPNAGIVGALNAGLALCRAPWIARMDADDVAAPDRLARQWERLQAEPDLVLLGAAVWMTDPAGRRLKPFRLPETDAGVRQDLWEGRSPGLVHPVVVMRKATVEAVGGYRSAYQWVEDIDLFCRMLEQGRGANLPERLLDYRQHAHSVNQRHQRQQRELHLRCVNEARSRAGLAALRALPPGTAPAPTRGALHRRWAEWAREGRQLSLARHHALWACVREPGQRRHWSLLKYLWTRSGSA